MTAKLVILWLFSTVAWGNHGGSITPGWYNDSAWSAPGECALAGAQAVYIEGIAAFLCQPEDFPRPRPTATAQE